MPDLGQYFSADPNFDFFQISILTDYDYEDYLFRFNASLFCSPVSVKILEKRHILREKKVPYVAREKEVLSRLSHPFFVQLYFTFQDKERLCILKNMSIFIHEALICF